MEHIPADGRRDHRGQPHLATPTRWSPAHFIYDAGRWPQFLAKASVFRVPVLGLDPAPVPSRSRSSGARVDAARALDAAVAAVDDGRRVVIYPEGTTTKEPDLWPMRGKTGAARLALATGAPVIPVAMWGPEQIFDPRTHKLRPACRAPRSPSSPGRRST